MHSPDLTTSSLQLRALQTYLALLQVWPDWHHRLTLIAASKFSSPLVLAVNAAGAAALLTAESAATWRDANQTGVTDFNVTTLAEAVRILKNEIRKGAPVSVGLLDAHGTAWDEIVRHGLQPDALSHEAAGLEDTAAVLLHRGAQDLRPLLQIQTNASDMLCTHIAQTWRERKEHDRLLIAAMQKLPETRRFVAISWMHAAERLFPRDRHRCYAASWCASNEQI